MVEELANEVKRYREAENLTQMGLAERMGVSRKTVNTVENGVFAPSIVVALKFAKALGVSVDALFQLRDWGVRREPRPLLQEGPATLTTAATSIHVLEPHPQVVPPRHQREDRGRP